MGTYSANDINVLPQISGFCIPFQLTFTYTHPQIDAVPAQSRVAVKGLSEQALENIVTIPQAIQLYLQTFAQQFTSALTLHRKGLWLQRFVEYLQGQGHSMLLADLTLADGKNFLDSLIHAYAGSAISPQTKRRYISALRTFGRFLFDSGLCRDDLFFSLHEFV